MKHQPLFAGLRQGEAGRGVLQVFRREERARCSCGWVGHWTHQRRELDSELAAHLALHRPE